MFAQGNREFAPGTYFGHWPRWEYWKQGNALQILLSTHTWALAQLWILEENGFKMFRFPFTSQILRTLTLLLRHTPRSVVYYVHLLHF